MEESSQQYDLDIMKSNQKLKFLKYQEEKSIFKQQILNTINGIHQHSKDYHAAQCECTNILNFLVANLECLIEDLDEWTSNDRESWKLVISPQGVCETGLQYPQKIVELLNETVNWDTEFREFCDPLMNSMKRIDKNEETSQEQEYFEDEEQLREALEKIKEQRKKLENKLESDIIPEKQNFFKEQEQEGEMQISSDEFSQFNQEVKQKQAEISKMIKELEQHIQQTMKANNNMKCDCYTLQNQFRQLEEDLPFWSSLDQQSWEATLKLLKIECEFGAKYQISCGQIVDSTKEWMKQYPIAMNQEKQIEQKIEGKNTKEVNFMQIDDLGQLDLVNIDKMQEELQNAMDQLNIWQKEIIQEQNEEEEDKKQSQN